MPFTITCGNYKSRLCNINLQDLPQNMSSKVEQDDQAVKENTAERKDQAEENGQKDKVEENGPKDLAEENRRLEAHVKQLRCIIAKLQSDAADKKKGKHREQRPFDFSKYNTRHVALKIAYLGQDYHGFAVQEDTDKTIENDLFEALTKTRLIEKRETSNYHRCGRTDKGVSAFSQVISIDLRTNLTEGVGVIVPENSTAHLRPGDKSTEIRYVRILNKVLPPQIRVLAWCPVSPDFSARFSCQQRTYKYFFPRGNLDIERMKAAGQKLLGEKDFRNLCKMDVGNGVVNFIRRILSIDITPLDHSGEGPYQMHELTVVGLAFLWHQIRCIVIILFLIGQGKEDIEIIDELLDVEKNPRKPQYTMASELPLNLFDCEFEDLDWIYDQEDMEENIKSLQAVWTESQIKATMVKRMLDFQQKEFHSRYPEASVVTEQVEGLMPGGKSRTYKPLLERVKCESLETRVEHYAKRRRIDKDILQTKGVKPRTTETESKETKHSKDVKDISKDSKDVQDMECNTSS